MAPEEKKSEKKAEAPAAEEKKAAPKKAEAAPLSEDEQRKADAELKASLDAQSLATQNYQAALTEADRFYAQHPTREQLEKAHAEAEKSAEAKAKKKEKSK